MTIIEQLGYLGSFVNAIAMIGSVIYLGTQIKQANNLARLNAVDSLRDATNHFREILLQGENLNIWLKGVRNRAALTESELYHWDELGLYLWDSTQATYLRALHFDEQFIMRRIAYTVRFASRGGAAFTDWWDARRERYHPDFVRFVDANVGQPVDQLNNSSSGVSKL